MAKKKASDVQKFGGTEELGDIKVADGLGTTDYSLSNVEAKSETKLEHDEGHGDAVVIRQFTFAMNMETFKEVRPNRQQLFNHHVKGIEIALWKDGLKVFSDVPPRLTIDEKNMRYSIYVAAKVARGHILTTQPKTLSQLANG